MGQAKLRGSREQRVSESVQRAHIERLQRQEREAVRMAAIELAHKEAHEALEKQRKHQQEQGQKRMVIGGRRTGRTASMILALAALGSLR
jgi:hypothetical protein